MATKAKDRPATGTPRTRYEDDLYTWVQEQVALLRAGRLSEVDAANVAEELSDGGKEQLFRLESAIAVLTLHLLKWDFQPDKRSRSWEATIREQRRRIDKLLRKNPGMKSELREAVADSYLDGRDRAAAETDLPFDAFPAACPYSFEEMMSRAIVYEEPPRRRKKH
jgi:hypothetical protein